jgi:capsular polysaccharide transport system permease protein
MLSISTASTVAHNSDMFSKIRHFAGTVNLGLLATVVVPTAFSIIYYAFWASDVYTSESRFVVRSHESTGPSTAALGSLLQGVGFSTAPDDSHSVREYILSRDALKALDQQMGLKAAYGSNHVDILSRFSGLDPDNSFEALHRYYQSKVDAQIDSTSSIITLNVRAFTAKDAANANRILLDQSEELVNRLNERGRQDLIRFASDEVSAAEAKAKAAALELSKYRNTQSVVDPVSQASVQLQQVAKLQDDLIATTTQLSQLTKFTPSNSQIPVLRSRARTLQDEITKETRKVTGGQTSLADKAAGYQYVVLEADFASKQLATALASLESARNEAQRKQIYIERISQPSMPDSAQEPRRVRNVAGSLIIGLLAWAVLTMLVAGIREHQD